MRRISFPLVNYGALGGEGSVSFLRSATLAHEFDMGFGGGLRDIPVLPLYV